MSGPVLKFDAAADEGTHRDRDRALRAAVYDAWHEAESSPSKDSVHKLFSAGLYYSNFWERIAQKAERLLNAALASDSLTDEERARILSTKKIKARDAKLLLDSEVEIVDMYRACSPKAKQAVREMLRWANAASPNTPRRRRQVETDETEQDVSSPVAAPPLGNLGKSIFTIDGDDDRPCA